MLELKWFITWFVISIGIWGIEAFIVLVAHDILPEEEINNLEPKNSFEKKGVKVLLGFNILLVISNVILFVFCLVHWLWN